MTPNDELVKAALAAGVVVGFLMGCGLIGIISAASWVLAILMFVTG